MNITIYIITIMYIQYYNIHLVFIACRRQSSEVTQYSYSGNSQIMSNQDTVNKLKKNKFSLIDSTVTFT